MMSFLQIVSEPDEELLSHDETESGDDNEDDNDDVGELDESVKENLSQNGDESPYYPLFV